MQRLEDKTELNKIGNHQPAGTSWQRCLKREREREREEERERERERDGQADGCMDGPQHYIVSSPLYQANGHVYLPYGRNFGICNLFGGAHISRICDAYLVTRSYLDSKIYMSGNFSQSVLPNKQHVLPFRCRAPLDVY